jgi:hypothetical protein
MRKAFGFLPGYVAVFTFLLCVAATAQPNPGLWSNNLQITSIKVSQLTIHGTQVLLSFTPAPYSNISCSKNNGQFILGGSTDNIGRMLSLATAALVSSRPVRVFWDRTSENTCYDGYPVLMGLTIK